MTSLLWISAVAGILFLSTIPLYNSYGYGFRVPLLPYQKYQTTHSTRLHSGPPHRFSAYNVTSYIDHDSKASKNTLFPTSSLAAAIMAFCLLSPFAVSAASTTMESLSPANIASKLGQQREVRKIPDDVGTILRDRIALVLRSGVTGERIGQLRVGESLVNRLRAVESELDMLENDIYKDSADWDVVAVYPKVLRASAPLFTAYTDRAFPTSDPVDEALRYALRYEVGAMYSGVQELEAAIDNRSPRNAQKSFAKISLAYDHYLKAGDLYERYEEDDEENTEAFARRYGMDFDDVSNLKLSYIAPSIEAPRLQDEVILLKGPDKGRDGTVLWISKGENGKAAKVVVKLQPRKESEDEADSFGTPRGEFSSEGVSTHREVRTYPYAWLAKTTPTEVQFADDLLAAYVASALSSGIMYPIDTYKTRIQSGRRGIPTLAEGGFFRLWSGVLFFIADANDAVYVASYGLLKPLLLGPIDVTNGLAVFVALSLAGSLGDALGSVFRVFCEIIYKPIQAGTMTTMQGFRALAKNIYGSIINEPITRRAVVLSWVAVLCRDMPFAGLQIAFFDLYKGLFAGLDDAGVSEFFQRAIWGAFAGGTAAVLTTPFDLLTTNVMLEAESAEEEVIEKLEEEQEALDMSDGESFYESEQEGDSAVDRRRSSSSSSSGSLALVTSASNSATTNQRSGATGSPVLPSPANTTSIELAKEIVQIFKQTLLDTLRQGGPAALFTGAVPRLLFFAPAGMIFFATYEGVFELLAVLQKNSA